MKKIRPKISSIKYLLIVLLSVFSLTAMAQNITLKKSDESLKKVLVEFSKQTKTEFMYNDEIISNYKVSVDFNKTPLTEAMVTLFENLPLKYTTKNGVVVISPDNNKKIAKPKGEEFTLKGKVIAKDDKTTTPGATAIIEGTTKGVIIGFEGTFSLSVKQGDVIVISYVGMAEKRYYVTEYSKDVIIELERANTVIEDVFVNGYGKIKTHENVGAVTTISGSDLEKTANRNISQMLQGKIAGLVVTNTSGMVGTRQKVKVRGTSTLLGNQEPVWVVDGMIQEDPLPFKTNEFNAFGDNEDMIKNFIGNAISWLNPNDIDKITILKDASATAIYGVKAANGVIVITTKRGKEGRMSVSYSGDFSFNQKSNYDKLHLMNSKERVDVSREIIQRGYTSLSTGLSDIGYEGAYKEYMNREISYDEFNRRAKFAEIENTDWLDLLMRNSFSNSHSVSLSGGTDKISYYSSLSANFNKGEDKQNQMSSYNANISVNAWIVPDKLSVDSRLSGSMSNTAGILVGGYDYALKTSRSIAAYNNGERFFYPYGGYDGDLLYNFENERDNTSNSNSQNQLNGSVAINWKIIRGLDFNASLGYAVSNSDGSSHYTELTHAMTTKRGYEFGTMTPFDTRYKESKLPHGGEYNHTQTKNFNYTARAQMSYNHTFKGQHRITGSVGYEMRSSKYDGYSETLYGYLPSRGYTFSRPPLTILEGKGSQGENYVENGIYEFERQSITDRISNYMSVYMTAGYSYKERYIISGNIRSDASNRFGQDSNAKFLPVFSIGARWNVSEEAWMQNQDVVNNLSFRGSYGWQGNVAENFGPDLIATLSGAPDYLTGEYMMRIKSLPYADLKWEKVKSYNFGTDFGLFKNKLQVSFNYYFKRTDDMIVYLDVPLSFGIGSMPINGGNMENSGWDITFTTTPIRTKNFNWTVSLNTAKNNNKIKSEMEPKRDWRTASGGQLNKEGYAYSSIWAFRYLGLNPANGKPLFPLYDSEDISIDPDDATTFMSYAGCLEPDFTGGISMSFKYKNLSLNTSFNLNIGSVRYLTPYVNNYTNLPKSHENMSKEFVDRWRKPGDELLPNVKPSLPMNVGYFAVVNGVYAYDYEMYNYSDKRVVSGNFLRCNNLALSYNLPSKLLEGTGIGNISINAGMSNPFKIVSRDFNGIDPEVATGGSPILKSFNFGISITL